MKLIKSIEETNKFKIAVSYTNCEITLFDLNLEALKTTTLKTMNEEII